MVMCILLYIRYNRTGNSNRPMMRCTNCIQLQLHPSELREELLEARELASLSQEFYEGVSSVFARDLSAEATH